MNVCASGKERQKSKKRQRRNFDRGLLTPLNVLRFDRLSGDPDVVVLCSNFPLSHSFDSTVQTSLPLSVCICFASLRRRKTASFVFASPFPVFPPTLLSDLQYHTQSFCGRVDLAADKTLRQSTGSYAVISPNCHLLPSLLRYCLDRQSQWGTWHHPSSLDSNSASNLLFAVDSCY